MFFRLAKFDKEKLKSKLGFREQLKSTGQSKYALEEKDEVGSHAGVRKVPFYILDVVG